MVFTLKERFCACKRNHIVCLGFCWLMFGVFPLFVTPGWFFTMNLAKYVFFMIAVFLLIILLLWRSSDQRTIQRRTFCWLPTDIAMILLCSVSIISGVCSEYFPHTLNGCVGRYGGIITMVLYTIVYFCLSRFCVEKQGILAALAISSCMVALLAVLNFFRIDLFHAYDHIASYEKELFISTIGNRNFLSSFFCLSIPVALVMFCCSCTRKHTICWVVALACNFAGLFVANSDSGFMGVFVLFATAPIFVVHSVRAFERFCCSLAIFLLVGQCFRMVYACHGPVLLDFSGAARLLIDCKMIIPACILLALCFIFTFPKVQNFLCRRLCWVRRGVAGMFGLAVLIACIAFVWYTFFDRQTDLGTWESYVRFSDLWGNMRGSVWRYAMQAFCIFPLGRMLIGTGPDTIWQVFSRLFPDDIAAGRLLVFDNVHNEYLQYLITTGLLGMAAYVVLVAGSCVQGFRHAGENLFLTACCCCVLCYAVQGTFNISMISTTPLLFVMLALIASELRIQRLNRTC